MSNEQFPNWVPQDAAGTRTDTATLLVGTAREFGLVVRHHVASTVGGYYITDALADLLESEADTDDTDDSDEAEPEVSGNETKAKAAPKKTSGKTAAKNDSQEGE